MVYVEGKIEEENVCLKKLGIESSAWFMQTPVVVLNRPDLGVGEV